MADEEDVEDIDIMRRQGLDIDQFMVAAGAEATVAVQNVGNATGHAGGEIAAGWTEDGHDTTGHVLAAMIPYAFDHGRGPGVTHAESFAGAATEECLTRGCSIESDVPGDDVIRWG